MSYGLDRRLARRRPPLKNVSAAGPGGGGIILAAVGTIGLPQLAALSGMQSQFWTRPRQARRWRLPRRSGCIEIAGR